MTKQNIIDLEAYREEHELPSAVESPISEELKEAIESLILKLRAQDQRDSSLDEAELHPGTLK
jgi:hypothetical protein